MIQGESTQKVHKTLFQPIKLGMVACLSFQLPGEIMVQARLGMKVGSYPKRVTKTKKDGVMT
jgi:hypothetical protein